MLAITWNRKRNGFVNWRILDGLVPKRTLQKYKNRPNPVPFPKVRIGPQVSNQFLAEGNSIRKGPDSVNFVGELIADISQIENSWLSRIGRQSEGILM